MAIAASFSPTGMTIEQYDETIKRLNDTGAHPAPGLLYHVCYGESGNLRVGEVWESREAFDKHGEALMPILKEVGVDAGQPEIGDVHNTIS